VETTGKTRVSLVIPAIVGWFKIVVVENIILKVHCCTELSY